MATYIRLTDYKSSDEKEQEFFNPENRYEAKQEDFSKIPASPIAYWVSDRIKDIFENSKKLKSFSLARIGLQTGDNDRFTKQWHEVDKSNLGLNITDKSETESLNFKWYPYNKGGEYRKWFGNNEFIVNWKNNGAEVIEFGHYLNSIKKASSRMGIANNSEFYFKQSLSWSKVTSSGLALRYFPNGFIFDVAGSSLFPFSKKDNYLILSIFNSKLKNIFITDLNPTLNFEAGKLLEVPIITPSSKEKSEQVDNLAKENIDISKEEWDSRETSWDFRTNELVRVKNEELKVKSCKIEDTYNRYCDYWREKFFQLHKNEEELNKLFIEIYGLEDELTPDVSLEDITILKNEAKIIDGELIFQADEIMKQFISYGVGVMFGRYSLDHEGLHIADMGVSLKDANLKFNIQHPTFKIDDDNVIPVLEDDYFSDDIASRFIEFVKVTFGEEYLAENIRFIENSLGTTLRKYFVKGFYEDHIKRYKKRPIYWMVASLKKGFMSLFYMHRYKSDIFATVQNSYLYEYITKLEASRENYQREADDNLNSNVQRSRATKQVEKIGKILEEVIKFDREVFIKYAQGSIEIDLDDGVKVNYCKFKDILYTIKGLCK